MERELNIRRLTAHSRISMVIERAILEGTPIYGITFDLAKAFDNIPIEVTFGVCKAVGNGWTPFCGTEGDVRQDEGDASKSINTWGRTFKDTNGILQGMPSLSDAPKHPDGGAK